LKGPLVLREYEAGDKMYMWNFVKKKYVLEKLYKWSQIYLLNLQDNI